VVGEIVAPSIAEQVFVAAAFRFVDLSQGTTDNGSGTAATLGAAENFARGIATRARSL